MARPRSPLSTFILSLPSSLSVKEVIEKAKAKGLKATEGNIYRVRRMMGGKAAKKTLATPSAPSAKVLSVTTSGDGATAKAACWVRRTQDQKFQVFAINCAHLGCPVRWFPQSELFMCPCHGGVYYGDGSRAAGPPPRGLFEYPYKVQDGKLMIDGGQMPTLATSASVRKESSQCTG